MSRKTFVLTVAILVGCSDQVPNSRFSSRDSAGIRIVESWESAWREGGTWVITEGDALDLTNTGQGPQHVFYRVAGATVLTDGRIVVANGGSSEVRAFSPAGSALISVGREGEGPGEYRTIMGLFRLDGDTISVVSWPTNLTVLSPELDFVRSFRLGDLGRAPKPLDHGRIVNLEIYPSVAEHEGGEQLIRGPVSLVLRHRDGSMVDTLWTGPGREEYMAVYGEGFGAMQPLFGKKLAFATRGSSVLVGTSDRMEYQVLDLEGRVQEIARVPDYDLTLPRSWIEAERAALLGPDPPPQVRRIVENLPVPETYPAYSEFLVDAAGYLWAGEFQPRYRWGEPRRWEVFAPNGEWMGPIQTPSGFEVFEIGIDYILGVFSDDLDIEHVQLIPLSRSAEG